MYSLSFLLIGGILTTAGFAYNDATTHIPKPRQLPTEVDNQLTRSYIKLLKLALEFVNMTKDIEIQMDVHRHENSFNEMDKSGQLIFSSIESLWESDGFNLIYPSLEFPKLNKIQLGKRCRNFLEYGQEFLQTLVKMDELVIKMEELGEFEGYGYSIDSIANLDKVQNYQTQLDVIRKVMEEQLYSNLDILMPNQIFAYVKELHRIMYKNKFEIFRYEL